MRKPWALFCFMWLVCSLFFFLYWLDKNFGEVTFNQLVFHMQMESAGMVDVDPKLVRSFIRGVVFWPFVLAAILCLITWRFAVHKRLRLIFSWRGAVGVCVVWGLAFFHQFGIAAHFSNSGQEDFFSKNYIDPKTVSVDLSNGRSLLLVYVESLERNYSDKSIFGRDLLAPLSVERRNGLTFERFEQMPGTSWTIASIVSSQCAIPLKSVMMFGGNKQGQNLASYLPGAMCLGDVLKQNGYKNIFMNGPDLSFSGMGVFMKTHGYDELYGRQEWLKKGYSKDKMNGWGLYDEDLFNESRMALDRLMTAGEPFNLTVLTIDAHGPEGFLSESCQKRGFVDGFESVLECSVHDLASLLDYVEEKGWSDRLSVVVVGDHLAMKNPVSEKLEQSKNRSVFNAFYHPGLRSSRSVINSFDMYPSVLASMGGRVHGGRLGLGYAAVGPDAVNPDPEWLEGLRRNSLNDSPVYESLWFSAH